jgi:archaellum biogenesis ATPase FlaH
MTTFVTEIPWLKKRLPEGIQIASSTLISGPGGTGKPLVELALADSWLKAGGSLIAIPLQYPSGEMIASAMTMLYHTDLKQYRGKVAYIQFDPAMSEGMIIGENKVTANILDPERWERAIERAEGMIEKSGPGVMVLGSALNLLLFSKRHKEALQQKMAHMLQEDKSRTYAFAVSTSAFASEIKKFTRMNESMQLFLTIERMKGVRFTGEEQEVPFTPEQLKEINAIAELTRKRNIPLISRS